MNVAQHEMLKHRILEERIIKLEARIQALENILGGNKLIIEESLCGGTD